MENCIFCKISKGEAPASKIYEDENFVAFLDINPVSFGHLLVIPKKHVVWMYEAEDEIISEIFKITKKLMLAIKQGLNCDFVQISVFGLDVPHFHVQLIPRYFNDGLTKWPTKKYKDSQEMQEMTQKIIEAL